MDEKLAINGGKPVRTKKNPPNFPGGMEIDEREEQAVLKVLRSKRLFRYYGPFETDSKVEELEKRFAQITSTKYALGLNSCTNALLTALLAAGVQPGDEVIVPAYTFIATAAAVVAANAIPVIVEIDDSYTIDPIEVEKNITKRTKAIIPVHMQGVACNMDAIIDIAKRYGLKVIEDSAQANGASYKGKALGSIGDAGCFSFQFHKTITAGEGGAITTDDVELLNRAKSIHDTGANWRKDDTIENKNGYPMFPGYNFRMNEITAAILLVQVERRGKLVSTMKKYSRKINEILAGFDGITLRRLNDKEGDTGQTVAFYLPTREKAVEVCKALQAEGLNFGTMEMGLPNWHVYNHWKHILNKKGNNDSGFPFTLTDRKYNENMCPRTLDLLGRFVNIGITPMYTEEDINDIIRGIEKVLPQIL